MCALCTSYAKTYEVYDQHKEPEEKASQGETITQRFGTFPFKEQRPKHDAWAFVCRTTTNAVIESLLLNRT